MAFDITSVLKGVSEPVNEDRIEYIEIDRIDPDPNNFYSLDGLEELAENIELIGLQQPLRVRAGQDGHVIIVSGHRRRAACMMLRDGGNRKFDRLPCIRDRGENSPEMQELRLIYANAATRVMSPAEISRQAERVEMLLYLLKEQGVEFPGRMRDHVAQACQVSRTKIARLHAIRNNLDGKLLEQFDAGRLNESVAYRISKEDPEVQRRIAETAGTTAACYDIHAAERDIILAKAPPIKRAEAPTFDGAGHLDFDVENYLEQRRQEDDEYFEMLVEVADGFLRELDAVNSRQEGIERLKEKLGKNHVGHTGLRGQVCFDASPKGLRLRRSLSVPGTQRTWTEVYDLLCSIALSRASKILSSKPKASESDTEPQWMKGTPKVIGSYVVIAGYPKKETPGCMLKTIRFWNGNEFVDERTNVRLDMQVYRWHRLPEE